MRRLALLPLLMFAFACNNSTPVQPDADLMLAATQAGRMVYDVEYLGDDPGSDWGNSRITPSNVLFITDFDFGYFVVGDLVGYQNLVGGSCKINLKNGKGTCNALAYYDFDSPYDGTFECRMHGSIENYPEHLQYAKIFSCKGTGDFEGKNMHGTVNNEANPGVGDFVGTLEIW